MNAGRKVLTDAERRAMRARYDEELLALDAQIGELFAELEAKGLWDETLVVVTADHGEEFFEHGGYFHGQSLHDELTHVPLIVKPPTSWQAPAGARVDGLAESRDISATLLAAAQVQPLPAGTVDLGPWVRGTAHGDAPRDFAVSESLDQVAIRSATHKLVVDRKGGGYRLFDLAADSAESRDVAAAEGAQLAQLRRQLSDWRRGLQEMRKGPTVEVDEETREGLDALGYVN